MSMVAFNGKVYTFKVPVATVYSQSSTLQMQIPYLPTIILEPGPALSLSGRAERTVKPPGGTIRHDKQGVGGPANASLRKHASPPKRRKLDMMHEAACHSRHNTPYIK